MTSWNEFLSQLVHSFLLFPARMNLRKKTLNELKARWSFAYQKRKSVAAEVSCKFDNLFPKIREKVQVRLRLPKVSQCD